MPESLRELENAIAGVAKRSGGPVRREVLLFRFLFFVEQAMSERLNRVLKTHQLNTTSWFTLIMVYAGADSAVHPSDLSRMTFSSRTNMTRVTDDLVTKGLLLRHTCAQDRRRVELSLTEAGTALVEELLPDLRGELERLWQDFDAEEMATFEALLRKLAARLEG